MSWEDVEDELWALPTDLDPWKSPPDRERLLEAILRWQKLHPRAKVVLGMEHCLKRSQRPFDPGRFTYCLRERLGGH